MDPFLLTVFTFVILLVLIVGGFVMLYPLSRRLAKWVDLQLEMKRGAGPEAREWEELRAAVRLLEAEVERVAERQSFTEAMLARGESERLPPAGPIPD